MRKLLSRLFGRPSAALAPGKITVEKLQHVLDYSVKFNRVGEGMGGSVFSRLGQNLSLQGTAQDIDLRKAHGVFRRDEVVLCPAHLKWGWMPTFAYVGLVEGKVEYRFGTEGQAAYYRCPIATDPEHIRQIDHMFEVWYAHYRLPGSLNEPVKRPAALDLSDRMALIRRYLDSGDASFLLEDIGADGNGILLWVDWRESDDDIVAMCEAILRTGQLSAEFVENEVSADLMITYKGKVTKAPYQGAEADRDTTLVALNGALKPDFEIRFCTASDGSDTLAFLPLSRDQWRLLEAEFPTGLEEYFTPITPQTRLFS